MINLDTVIREAAAPVRTGRITRAAGPIAEAKLPGLSVGSVVMVYPQGGAEPIEAEVVGVREETALLMPIGEIRGIAAGNLVVPEARETTIAVGAAFLGRVVDPRGRPLDGKGPIQITGRMALFPEPVNPLARTPIREALSMGIRSIDSMLTFGRGQRLAIMAGSGVGKSTLLGMIASGSEAEVNVIGLIGERGREVREFLDKVLDEEALARSVVVVATSDTPALFRIRGAFLTTALAEYFRAQGADVLLLLDSLTRVAMAQREVGLAAGEPPTTKGYTPSVFSLLPRLLERAGTVEGQGSTTGVYTVLTEGDDIQDPIADAVRAVVDGHLVLSRALSDRGHYPPIDVLRSISRVMPDIVDAEHGALAARLRSTLATYEEAEDLINLGAYVRGSSPAIDDAILRIDSIRAFLKQQVGELAPWADTQAQLAELFEPRR